MSNTCYPDYKKDCILSIPNSILLHYGAKPHHNTLNILDEHLKKNYKTVVLWILDGMGMSALLEHAPNGFLMKHLKQSLGSIYPCTTTAALTTYETGLTPLEHAWLGWAMYFKEIDKSVELFTGKQSGTDKACEENIVWNNIGYQNLFRQIKKADESIECCRVSPFGEYKTSTNYQICEHISNLSQKEGRRYIYAYHHQPDGYMHHYGCSSEQVAEEIRKIDKQIERLSKKLKNTLLIVTADHGLVDITESYIEDYPDIHECLRAVPTREPRSLSFFVKQEYMEVFPDRWNKHFSEDFKLMTAKEALESGIFGKVKPHPRIGDFLGDFTAFATGRRMLWFRDEDGKSRDFKGAHAGLLSDEMTVPLILIECI